VAWKNWNQSGISYYGSSQYLNQKSSPYGDQDLCVNAWTVTMYWCGSRVAEQVKDHQKMELYQVLSNYGLHII
jgi:hypothetical protein